MSPPIAVVVMQHVEEAVHLRQIRTLLVRAPHVRLHQLGRLDERIAAHLDGIKVAGEYGARLVRESLDGPGVGPAFVAATRAIEDRDIPRLDTLTAVAQTLLSARAGLLSAFGWVSAERLRGITAALLASTEPWRREVGLAACAMHGVNPGVALESALRSVDANLRARALRVAASCGRRDLLETCVSALADADKRCAFDAARSALLLGDRTDSLAALESLAIDRAGDFQLAALRLALKVAEPKHAQAMLALLAKDSAKDTARLRTVMHGIAAAGDPHYVPWLIAQMQDQKLARLAGEAVSFITGLDLAYLDLELKPPESIDVGPNDDPEDENVAMDEDDSLPWPDPEKIAAWWQSNGARFVTDTRYFMGEPPSTAKCIDVLKTGFQRQRIAAAEYLSLMSPGTPLFNTSAPAWRQQRLLANMAA